jgi:hypothetical protein
VYKNVMPNIGKHFRMIIFCLWTLPFITKGENPCGRMVPQNNGDWGQAALWIPAENVVKGYSTPNGVLVDSIYRNAQYGRLLNSYYGDSINVGKTSGYYGVIMPEDIVMIADYSYSLLKVKQEKDGFYQILTSTIQGGIWVRKAEITGDMKVYKYRDLLLSAPEKLSVPFNDAIKWSNIGVNLSKSCLKLRAEPSTVGKEFFCLPCNDWTKKTITHLEIRKVKGDWAYVHVKTEEYAPELDDSGEGCAYRIVKEQDGWVKAIDDNGYPNIWYSVTVY